MTEVELWSGERKSLTNAASGGKVAGARYRVTDRAVYASVGLVRNSENQLPLHLVSDVDVRQGMAQRARGVGDVVVHARHSDGTLDALTLESVQDPKSVRDLINDAALKARQRETAMHNRQQVEYTGTVPVQPNGSGDGDVMTQLRQLGELRDAGVITGEDFEQKKRELLGRI